MSTTLTLARRPRRTRRPVELDPSRLQLPTLRRCDAIEAARMLIAEPNVASEHLTDRYGDIVYFELAGQKWLLLRDPDAIGQVLRSKCEHAQKGAYTDHAKRILGSGGLVTADNATHEPRRKALQPAFQPRAIPQYTDLVARETRHEADAWSEGAGVDMHERLSELTLRIAVEAFFGVREMSGSAGGVSGDLTTVLDDFRDSTLLRRKAVAWAPLPVNVRFWRARARLRAAVTELMDLGAARPDRAPFLDLLLASPAHDARGRADDALTILLAGHETTAGSLSFAFTELARNPEVLEMARAEVAQLGDRPITADDLTQLEYVKRVFLEALRLWPSVYMMDRTAVDEPLAMGDYAIPAGTNIAMSIWALHRNEQWYPEPLRFDPDRHTKDASAARPRHAYLPFGAGRRVCMGNAFAVMEGTVVLATLLQRWNPGLPPGATVAAQPTFTLRPSEPLVIVPTSV